MGIQDSFDNEQDSSQEDINYRELCQLEVTIKIPSVGMTRPFTMTLAKHEHGYWWWGSDSTEEKRISNFFAEVEDAIASQQNQLRG